MRAGIEEESGRQKGKGTKRVGGVCNEMGRLFPQFKKGPKNKKRSTWTHKFVCLAKKDQHTIPTTAWEKDILITAGLGERKVTFDDVDCSADEFKQEIINAFPKLSDAGGYRLYKCMPNTRDLEPLSVTTLTSPRALQGCGGNSRTYIHPLQIDLDLTKTTEYDDDDVCIICINYM